VPEAPLQTKAVALIVVCTAIPFPAGAASWNINQVERHALSDDILALFGAGCLRHGSHHRKGSSVRVFHLPSCGSSGRFFVNLLETSWQSPRLASRKGRGTAIRGGLLSSTISPTSQKRHCSWPSFQHRAGSCFQHCCIDGIVAFTYTGETCSSSDRDWQEVKSICLLGNIA
jgi:hypothetical protein